MSEERKEKLREIGEGEVDRAWRRMMELGR